MRDLELTLTGPGAETAARALAAALDDAGLTLTPRPLPAPLLAVHKGVDPVALTGLILAIPGAVLAAFDLAERIKKRRRAQALVETAVRIRIEQRVEVLTLTTSGPRALADLDPDAVLDLVAGD